MKKSFTILRGLFALVLMAIAAFALDVTVTDNDMQAVGLFLAASCVLAVTFPVVQIKSFGLLAGTFTGATEYNNIQIQKAVQSLAFVISDADWAELSGYTISVDKQGRNGKSVQLFNRIKLTHLAEMAARGEGSVYEIQSATAANEKCYFLVDLVATNHALQLETDETLQISIYGATSAHSIALYGIENGAITDNYRRVHRYDIAASGTKHFSKPEGQILAVEAANLTDVTLTYINGKSATYLKAELEVIAYFENDTVIQTQEDAAQSGTFGYDELLLVDMENVAEIKVNVSGATKVYFVEDVDPEFDGLN